MLDFGTFPLGLAQIAFTVGGVLLGIIIGVLPGLGPLLGMVLLTPFSMYMEPVAGSCYTFPARRSPPRRCSTAIRWRSRARRARRPSAMGGFIGGLYLILGAPVLARFALNFGPPEYFALAFAGIVCIAIVSRGSTVKGLIVGCIGLLIATIGIDPFAFFYRFNFDTQWLIGGIGIVPLVLGLFAVIEMMLQVSAGGLNRSAGVQSVRIPPSTILDTLKSGTNLVRSSTIGTFIGALPGVGSVIASIRFLRRGEERVARTRKLWQRQSGRCDRHRIGQQCLLWRRHDPVSGADLAR